MTDQGNAPEWARIGLEQVSDELMYDRAMRGDLAAMRECDRRADAAAREATWPGRPAAPARGLRAVGAGVGRAVGNGVGKTRAVPVTGKVSAGLRGVGGGAA